MCPPVDLAAEKDFVCHRCPRPQGSYCAGPGARDGGVQLPRPADPTGECLYTLARR